MYEKLLDEALAKGITVIDNYPFRSPNIRGLCCDDTIALSAQIDTTAERTVILCEELAHATGTVGDILHDGKAEHRTRQQTFDRLGRLVFFHLKRIMLQPSLAHLILM